MAGSEAIPGVTGPDIPGIEEAGIVDIDKLDIVSLALM